MKCERSRQATQIIIHSSTAMRSSSPVWITCSNPKYIFIIISLCYCFSRDRRLRFLHRQIRQETRQKKINKDRIDYAEMVWASMKLDFDGDTDKNKCTRSLIFARLSNRAKASSKLNWDKCWIICQKTQIYIYIKVFR